MLKTLLRQPWVQAPAPGLVGRYLELALGTTRWTLHGDHHVLPYVGLHPAILAFWHERLALMPAGWTLIRDRNGGGARAHVLVSRHQDGRFIGEVLRRFGVTLVYGSTARNGQHRGGAAGARTLLGVLQGANFVVITPDGPRGPRRIAALGVAQLAALSGAPVIPCAAQTSRRWTLPTWDRMVLPLPFGRGVIVCGPPIEVGRDAADAALGQVSAALTAVTEEADALCP